MVTIFVNNIVDTGKLLIEEIFNVLTTKKDGNHVR
jgi:hypothetical protein